MTFTSDIHYSINCHKCKINDVGGGTPKNESLANIIVVVYVAYIPATTLTMYLTI